MISSCMQVRLCTPDMFYSARIKSTITDSAKMIKVISLETIRFIIGYSLLYILNMAAFINFLWKK